MELQDLLQDCEQSFFYYYLKAVWGEPLYIWDPVQLHRSYNLQAGGPQSASLGGYILPLKNLAVEFHVAICYPRLDRKDVYIHCFRRPHKKLSPVLILGIPALDHTSQAGHQMFRSHLRNMDPEIISVFVLKTI